MTKWMSAMTDPTRDPLRPVHRRRFLALAAAGAAAAGSSFARAWPDLDALPIPDLGDEAILRFVAGLRPYRKAGLRIEREERGGKHVIHAYGHGGAGVTLSWGTAREVARLVADVGQPRGAVAVIGAGVIGLTAAHVLAEAGCRVRVLAKEFPPDTTSNLAGAEWMPFGVAPPAGADGARRYERIVRESHAGFEKRVGESWGVYRRAHYEEGDPAAMQRGVPDDLIRIRPLARLPFPGPIRSGASFETFLIEPPVFLPRLVAEVLRLGAVLERRVLGSLAEVDAITEPVIVNATGLGARELCGDDALTAIRGQLVHLFPQRLPYLLAHRDGYCFPRHDAVVLGGTYERDVFEPTPVEADCRAILDRHRAFFAPAAR
jgi:D-amino-acid oxidase